MYRAIGGRDVPVQKGPGKWDMEFHGLVVELDEENHFNRYRLSTLRSPLYTSLTRFPLDAYKSYCVEHERDCLSYGRYWTNPSAEKQFGPSAACRDLESNGSSRWRQRAFYDYMKDLSSIEFGVPLVRLATWDYVHVGNDVVLLRDVLLNPDRYQNPELADLVARRLP